MEKFYIVKNEKFLKEIEDFKENEINRNSFIKEFFEGNGISGSGYYIRGNGSVNCAFSERSKENIELYVDDCEENVEKFGKQLLKAESFGGHYLRRFRKGCAMLKDFQNKCIEKQIVINSYFHREGDWFNELHFGGYSTTRFFLDGVYYLKISTSRSGTITPTYDGFVDIKGSDFYKALEKYEELQDKE